MWFYTCSKFRILVITQRSGLPKMTSQRKRAKPGTCTKCGKNSFNVMTLHTQNSNGHRQQLTIFACIFKVLSRIPLVRPNKSTLSSVCSLYLETNSSDDVSLGTSLGEMSIFVIIHCDNSESFWIINSS